MSISYDYVEIKTFNHLKIGDGSPSLKHWDVMDHEGITIQLNFLNPSYIKVYLNIL